MTRTPSDNGERLRREIEAAKLAHADPQESRLATMMRGTLARKRIKFPGTDAEVEIAVVPRAAKHDAVGEACRAFEARGIPVNTYFGQWFTDEVYGRLLVKALTWADTGEPVAASSEQLLELCADDVLDVLITEYQDHEESVSPDPYELSDDDYERLTAAVKKKDARVAHSFGSRALTAWAISMADRLPSSPMRSSGSGSGSSPSTETSEPSSTASPAEEGQ